MILRNSFLAMTSSFRIRSFVYQNFEHVDKISLLPICFVFLATNDFDKQLIRSLEPKFEIDLRIFRNRICFLNFVQQVTKFITYGTN